MSDHARQRDLETHLRGGRRRRCENKQAPGRRGRSQRNREPAIASLPRIPRGAVDASAVAAGRGNRAIQKQPGVSDMLKPMRGVLVQRRGEQQRIDGGVFFGSRFRSGWRVTIFAMMSVMVSPSNACRAVSIS